MRKALSMLVWCVILCGSVHAMIQTLPLAELIAGSDLIVIASLKSSQEKGKTAEGFTQIENLMTIATVLKGDLKPGAEVSVATVGGFEDGVTFPPAQKGVLFLKRTAAGGYEVNNLVQGWWDLGPNDVPAGMGTGTTMDQLKQAIKDVASGKITPQAPAPEGEQL